MRSLVVSHAYDIERLFQKKIICIKHVAFCSLKSSSHCASLLIKQSSVFPDKSSQAAADIARNSVSIMYMFYRCIFNMCLTCSTSYNSMCLIRVPWHKQLRLHFSGGIFPLLDSTVQNERNMGGRLKLDMDRADCWATGMLLVLHFPEYIFLDRENLIPRSLSLSSFNVFRVSNNNCMLFTQHVQLCVANHSSALINSWVDLLW